MILPIVQYGDPVLRKKGRPITKITDEIRQLADDMLETMYEANGVGLAAQQVGRDIQLTVIDVQDSDERPSTMHIQGERVALADHMPVVLINPQLELSKDTEPGTEGCLSFPDVTASIVRSASVKVKATGIEGEPVEFESTGLLARAVQHETDHLNGILFIDRMSRAAKAGISGKLKRLQRQ